MSGSVFPGTSMGVLSFLSEEVLEDGFTAQNNPEGSNLQRMC